MNEIEMLKKRIKDLEDAHQRLLLDVNREFKRLAIENERERKRYKNDIQTIERNIKRLAK